MKEALQRVAEAAFRRAFFFPFGFSAENAESDLEGRIALRGEPRLEAIHLPCRNAAPGCLAALSRQVVGRAAARARERRDPSQPASRS